MKTFTRSLGIAMAVLTAVALPGAAFTQPMSPASSKEAQAAPPPMTDRAMPGHDGPGPSHMPGMMQHQGPEMLEMHRKHMAQMAAANAAMPGQDAFGAIHEIVAKLEADPKTDWTKVNLEALRQHLVDMNEVTLRADAEAKPIDGGLEIAVTGSGRTLTAIQRMVTTHAQEINGLNGWSTKTVTLPNGVLLTVISSDPKETTRIRGLGFIGILVSGSHHQPHHLAMAKGEFSHAR
jgi:uncharacterized protein involved in copper resistance